MTGYLPFTRSPPFLSKNADKKEMEEIKCQKNITFMLTDKGGYRTKRVDGNRSTAR